VTNFNGSNLVAAAVRTEFWAVGLRNPYRMSFDEVTGELYVGDVGQGAREEVDLIQKGGNYGWKYREGFLSNPNVPAPPAGFTNPINPILDYPRSDGSVITGGRVYRGDRFPELVGRYIFTDYGSGNIWSLTNNGTNVTTKTLLAIDAPIAGFGKDPRNGDLLLAHRGADQIKRLERALTSTNFPQTLSAAGVFADLGSLIPYAGIVPFDINVPFWSDNAIKSRWFSLPNTNLTFTFNREASWVSPTTTVWIKHFDLLLTSGVPASARRVETRLLVKNDDGNGGYGVTYRWGTSTSDAALVLGAGQDEEFVINDGGTIRTQVWHYPSRSECLTCHKTVAGFALGFNTPQMNKSFSFGPPSTNQIMALSDAGYFSSPVTNYHTLRSLASAGDTAVSLEYRVRSYFQANCGQCHLPGGGTPVAWDARVFTPVSQANIINGDVTGPEPWRFISPGQTTNSMALARISIRGDFQMPPLASSVVDTGAVALVASWINALAGYQSFSEWQVFHFGSSNAPGTGAEEDFDGDGALNNLEYLTGTHPTNGLDAWTVAGVSISNHIPQVLFDRVANRGFDVQVNTNLLDGGWQSLDVPGNAPFFGITPQGVTVGDVTTNGALEQRNYRVRVYEP
jgi:mono/diheme cytochrome c family protein